MAFGNSSFMDWISEKYGTSASPYQPGALGGVAYGSGLASAFHDSWLAALQTAQAQAQAQARSNPIIAKATTDLLSRIDQLAAVPATRIAARVPDVIGTLTAWRGWKLTNGKLCALGMSGIWEPKQAVRSICTSKTKLKPDEHEAPARGCNCGYWSFRSLDLLKKALGPYSGSIQVLGTVEIWGKVVECENGYRSEYAYPKELWLLGDDMEHLSWTYGVPVRKLG